MSRTRVSDEYREAMRGLGEKLDPAEGWQPMVVDGEVVAYYRLPAQRTLDEVLPDLLRDIGYKFGEC